MSSADFQALDAVSKVPLLKAANLEEGGSGGMSDGTLFGWPMLCAASGDPEMADQFGAVCGCAEAGIGINWTFSPVCNLDINYLNPITNVRTFGSDLARVKEFTARNVTAVHRCGVDACAKHFPGDGVDYRDQHLHPTVNLPLRRRQVYGCAPVPQDSPHRRGQAAAGGASFSAFPELKHVILVDEDVDIFDTNDVLIHAPSGTWASPPRRSSTAPYSSS